MTAAHEIIRSSSPDPDIVRKLTKARALLLIEQPFFGVLALRLHLVETESVPTLAVDGHSVFYNRQFVEDLTPEQTRTALAHEVSHCVFSHIGRRGPRDPRKWNYAGDFVINGFLEESGFDPIPGYWNRNKAFDGMSADQVYNLLPDSPKDDDHGGQGQQPLCDVRNGSGPSGQSLDGSEQTMQDNDWQVAVLQAANSAKQAGKLPASIERFIHDATEPQVDWRAQLRNLVTERSKNDYSWARPSRRFAALGVVLPTLYSESMGTIVVVTDDSGSISNDILAAFEAEIKDIRATVMPMRTIHISCDARINHIGDFSMEDEFRVVSKGGGGTDFRPPFDYLDQEGIAPVVLIYLTDLYGPAPDAPPAYPVVWCCTTDQRGPWGDTVHIVV